MDCQGGRGRIVASEGGVGGIKWPYVIDSTLIDGSNSGTSHSSRSPYLAKQLHTATLSRGCQVVRIQSALRHSLESAPYVEANDTHHVGSAFVDKAAFPCSRPLPQRFANTDGLIHAAPS